MASSWHGPGTAKAGRTAETGDFLITGVPVGGYLLAVESPGYVSLRTEEFAVRLGFTYIFQEPLELMVAAIDESITLSRHPVQCRNRGPASKR
jgi:hypothetical protein